MKMKAGKPAHSGGRGRDPSPTREPGYMDGEWFREMMDYHGLTLRSIADVMEWNSHTTTQKLMNGTRKLKLSEVDQMAHLLSVTPAEILQHAGLVLGPKQDTFLTQDEKDSLTTVYGRGMLSAEAVSDPVPVVGWIDSDLSVHEDAIGITPGAGASFTGEGKPRALRFQTIAGGYSAFDGAMLIFEERDHLKDVWQSYNGKICVVRRESGPDLLRIVSRGHTPGVFTLLSLEGQQRERNIPLSSIWPVLLIRFMTG